MKNIKTKFKEFVKESVFDGIPEDSFKDTIDAHDIVAIGTTDYVRTDSDYSPEIEQEWAGQGWIASVFKIYKINIEQLTNVIIEHTPILPQHSNIINDALRQFVKEGGVQRQFNNGDDTNADSLGNFLSWIIENSDIEGIEAYGDDILFNIPNQLQPIIINEAEYVQDLVIPIVDRFTVVDLPFPLIVLST